MSAFIELRSVGTSDLVVPAVSLGTWGIGGGSYGATDDDESIETIDAALANGMTLLDTSPVYGRAEHLIGLALAGRRSQALIVTKCGLVYDQQRGRLYPDSRRETILESLQRSLTRMRTDYVDIALIHWPDPSLTIADAMEGLNAALDAKLTRYVGVSNFDSTQLREAKRHAPIVCNEVSFSLLDRRWEREMFATAQELGVGVLAYWVLAGGLLTGSVRRNVTFSQGDWRNGIDSTTARLWFGEPGFGQNLAIVEELARVAARLGVTLAQMALAWVLTHTAIATAVCGARSPARIPENAAASTIVLSNEDAAEMTHLSQASATSFGPVPTWSTA